MAMKTRRTTPKAIMGMAFIIAGLLIAISGLVSGSHAFESGSAGVVGLCFAGLLLIGTGSKIIYDVTRSSH